MLVVTAATTLRSAAAQGQSFVFHVYVDPIYGDDQLAYATMTSAPPSPPGTTNKGNPTAATVFTPHPTPSFQLGRNAGRIVHAPLPFRTLTRSFGAMNYILNNFLPLPNTFNGATMTHIVIHLLPGVYGGGNAIDARSGLRFNDEVLPITFNDTFDRVSLQGASALNTVIDAQGAVTNILLFAPVMGGEPVFVESIVDGITFRGARSDDDNAFGAAIVMTNERSCRPTISNCYITDNQVGFAIWSDEDMFNPGLIHMPIIVNNTISQNQVGIWSGAFNSMQVQAGYGKPRILNNIIDSKNSYFPGLMTSCFEGVHFNDTTVRQFGTNPVVMIDMNAWEAGRAQLGVVPPGYPTTIPRSPSLPTPGPAPAAPRVDIGPFTNAGSTAPRGTLFISDLLRNRFIGTGTYFPESEHDFRLSPLVGPSASTVPTTLNPLVNMGLDTSLGAIQMWNGYSAMGAGEDQMGATTPPIVAAPGPMVAVPPNSLIHAWDWDGEGFGNPRIVQRPGGFPVPNPPNGPSLTLLDLGADEMGDLIMTGFIEGTTIYARNVPGAAGIADHTGVTFIDVANVTRPRPEATFWLGQHYTWWTHVQSNPWPNPAPFVTNYTAGVTGSVRRGWWSLIGYFPRNLECDYAGHLVLDIQPWWGTIFNDGLGCNAAWHNGPTWQGDNWTLYYDAGTPPWPGGTLDSTISPPGSWLFTAGNGYLFPGQARAPFGPFSGGGATTYATDAWGMGDALGWDVFPDTLDYGLRVTCELLPSSASAQSNIQSFLGINSAQPTEGMRNAARRPGYRAQRFVEPEKKLPDFEEVFKQTLRGRR